MDLVNCHIILLHQITLYRNQLTRPWSLEIVFFITENPSPSYLCITFPVYTSIFAGKAVSSFLLFNLITSEQRHFFTLSKKSSPYSG